MTVYVKISGHLSALFGKAEIRLNLAHISFSSIKDILSEIGRIEGKQISPIIRKADGDSRAVLNIVLNGKLISARDGLEIKVHDGDHLTIVPFIAGG